MPPVSLCTAVVFFSSKFMHNLKIVPYTLRTIKSYHTRSISRICRHHISHVESLSFKVRNFVNCEYPHSPVNTLRRFAFGASIVCLVGEPPTCSVLALLGMRGSMVIIRLRPVMITSPTLPPDTPPQTTPIRRRGASTLYYCCCEMDYYAHIFST